jgi:hypothetical protein
VSKIRRRPKKYGRDEANPSFIMTRLVMLDSVTYWSLKPIERTVLAVIEIEHMRHGGAENGRLIVTRRQFEKRGVPKQVIAPSIRALEALGFIEITQRGAAGVGEHAQAHRFRLTYVQPNPTDEWRKHHDPTLTRAVAETARKSADIRARRLGLRGGKKQIAGTQTDTGKVSIPIPGAGLAVRKWPSIGIDSDTGAGIDSDTTIYISGGRGGALPPPPPGLASLPWPALRRNLPSTAWPVAASYLINGHRLVRIEEFAEPRNIVRNGSVFH